VYSCQCRGVSVNKLGTLSDYGMKEWRCIGHYDWGVYIQFKRAKQNGNLSSFFYEKNT